MSLHWGSNVSEDVVGARSGSSSSSLFDQLTAMMQRMGTPQLLIGAQSVADRCGIWIRQQSTPLGTGTPPRPS